MSQVDMAAFAHAFPKCFTQMKEETQTGIDFQSYEQSSH